MILACAAWLATGCAGRSPATHGLARSFTPHTRTAAAPGATTATRRLLAARYLAIAQPANHRLDQDFDGLRHIHGHELAAAPAYLRDAAATERQFDRRVLALAFPARTEQIVRLLFIANEARAALTSAAAASTSLRQLHSYQQLLDAANGPVEQAVQVIRSHLGLPPPDTS